MQGRAGTHTVWQAKKLGFNVSQLSSVIVMVCLVFEMPAIPFPCNGHLPCYVEFALLMFFNKLACCPVPNINLHLYFL